jgi:hypothetical protein
MGLHVGDVMQIEPIDSQRLALPKDEGNRGTERTPTTRWP